MTDRRLSMLGVYLVLAFCAMGVISYVRYDSVFVARCFAVASFLTTGFILVAKARRPR